MFFDSSEPLRAQERVNQVDKKEQGGDSGNDKVHIDPLLTGISYLSAP
jgi:hypothetical protein